MLYLGKKQKANGVRGAPLGNDDSVKSTIQRITDIIEGSSAELREYKKEIDMLRQEIALMENHLSTQNDENVKVVNPFIMSNFEELSSSIIKQKKENEHMQKQLIELKKEKSLMQQMIITLGHKISELEDQVGC